MHCPVGPEHVEPVGQLQSPGFKVFKERSHQAHAQKTTNRFDQDPWKCQDKTMLRTPTRWWIPAFEWFGWEDTQRIACAMCCQNMCRQDIARTARSWWQMRYPVRRVQGLDEARSNSLVPTS